MKVNKEIVKKIKRLNKIVKEWYAINKDLHEYFKSDMGDVYFGDYCIVDEPRGDARGDGEYCVQWTGVVEDSGYGTYYYPIEGSKKFVAITYEF